MKNNEKKNRDEEKQPAVKPASTNNGNATTEHPARNPAEEDLGDLGRNLNEQFGGTGNTVRVEPNHY